MDENSAIIDRFINLMRKEIEKFDYFLGVHSIFSLEGGTGSGFGCRLVEEMVDLL